MNEPLYVNYFLSLYSSFFYKLFLGKILNFEFAFIPIPDSKIFSEAALPCYVCLQMSFTQGLQDPNQVLQTKRITKSEFHSMVLHF